MKRILILIIIILALPTAFAVQIAVDAAVIKTDPYPVAPGQQMDVWIRVTNYAESSPDFVIELVPEYPFSPAPGQGSVRVGSIPHNQESVVKYRVAVDSAAMGIDKNITFRYSTTPDHKNWIEFEHPILIRTKDALVVVDQYALNQIIPGDFQTMTLTVKNKGKELLRNVDIRLDFNGLPLTGDGKGTTQRVGTMNPEQSTIITFNIQADPTASLKTYQLPVTFTFEDSSGRNYTEETSLSVQVNAEPEIQATIDDFTAAKSTPGDVMFRIVNKGLPNLKFVSVKLLGHESFDILSPSDESYLGNIDSDDFETADFKVEPKADMLTLPLSITFKDAYNKQYTRSAQLQVVLKEPEKKSSYGFLIPWIIIIVLVVLLIWRRRK